MATSVPRIRLVKCPKCRQILPEHSDVPVYQCAGCNTVLRAKNRGISGNGTSSRTEIKSSQRNESTIGDDAKIGQCIDQDETGCVRHSSSVSPAHESEKSKDSIKINGGVTNEQLALIPGNREKNSQPKTDDILDERVEVTQNSSHCDLDNSRSNERKEETMEDHSLMLGEDLVYSITGEVVGTSKSSTKSSSCGDWCDECVPNQSLITKEKDMKIPDPQQHAEKQMPISSSEAMHDSTVDVQTQERLDSQESDYFYSVQNWTDSDKEDLPSTSKPRQNHIASKYLHMNASNPYNNKQDQLEILKKVDELRDQLVRTYGHTSGSSQIHFSEQPTTHACVPCHPNICCRACTGHICFHIDSCDVGLDRHRPMMLHHVLPVSGGAPFIVCYKCRASLQLPVDFLLSRRKRCHKLRCGACDKVLAFTLLYGTLLVPNSDSAMQNFLSKAEGSVESSYATHEHSYAEGEPISYSEEYEMSFEKSYSTEGERPLVPSPYSERSNEKEVNCERRAMVGSKLHGLMGYSTPSQVIRGCCSMNSVISKENSHSNKGDMGVYDDDDELYRRKNKKGLPLAGIVKRGLRELNHGLESVKLKVQSSGRVIPDPVVKKAQRI
ncbi:hypothetical protein QJS04_geneDACA005803 [Acorus gramineus]|uniref:Zinc-ribbon domain-containing protein n=1 Tax=Acorus gramineus TaxID=55184 RepID=A0AAV9B3A6_ACOGR|nr:hypothetical protein QJS04_geneDACA005803 [Acorus gramineus]